VVFRGGEPSWPAEMQFTAHNVKEGGTKRSAVIPRLEEDANMCPVWWTHNYLKVTEAIRASTADKLFISSTKPHGNLSSDRLRNWFKGLMKDAGIDVERFRPHSARGEATTEALEGGTPYDEVLKSGNWSTKSTFERHYHMTHRETQLDSPRRRQSFTNTVLRRTLKRSTTNR
jgi:integrase